MSSQPQDLSFADQITQSLGHGNWFKYGQMSHQLIPKMYDMWMLMQKWNHWQRWILLLLDPWTESNDESTERAAFLEVTVQREMKRAVEWGWERWRDKEMEAKVWEPSSCVCKQTHACLDSGGTLANKYSFQLQPVEAGLLPLGMEWNFTDTVTHHIYSMTRTIKEVG